MNCKKFYKADYVFNNEGIPKCSCGGIIKADVVLYEEGLNNNIIINSILAIQNAEILIVAGTSLMVEPAASLINYFRGKYLILINKDSTPYDYKANLIINDKLGNVFKEI